MGTIPRSSVSLIVAVLFHEWTDGGQVRVHEPQQKIFSVGP